VSFRHTPSEQRRFKTRWVGTSTRQGRTSKRCNSHRRSSSIRRRIGARRTQRSTRSRPDKSSIRCSKSRSIRKSSSPCRTMTAPSRQRRNSTHRTPPRRRTRPGPSTGWSTWRPSCSRRSRTIRHHTRPSTECWSGTRPRRSWRRRCSRWSTLHRCMCHRLPRRGRCKGPPSPRLPRRAAHHQRLRLRSRHPRHRAGSYPSNTRATQLLQGSTGSECQACLRASHASSVFEGRNSRLSCVAETEGSRT